VDLLELSFLSYGFLLSIMQRQEELAFFKALSTLQISPAILKELRTALASSKKKTRVRREPRHHAPSFKPERRQA
jgi:hypothetical protein